MLNRFTAVLLASVSLLPTAAHAQEDQSASDEIVVTAQKREELLREVPQSVTALTAETFERTQANDLQDYVGRIPGMAAIGSIGEPGTTTVVLRGISAGGGTSSTATYVDDTPYGFSVGLVGRGAQMTPDLDPYDLARLEVLRGPQGTLYGASAMGGVVRFVTQDPVPGDFSGVARASTESTEDGDPSYTARLGLNIPLGHQAGLRLSGFHREEGGYIDDVTGPYIADDVNGSESDGLRAKFLLHATDDLTFRISTAQQEFSADTDSGVDYNFPPTIASLGVPLPESVPVPEPTGGALEHDRNLALPAQVVYRVHNGTIDWDLGWASLLSSTSYTEYENDSVKDATTFVGGLLEDDFVSDKTTQEFRLVSPSVDQGFDWIAGIFYTEESGALIQSVATGPAVGSSVSVLVDYEEFAGFGTITYHFSPKFDVSAGVRYASSDSSAAVLGTGAFAGASGGDESTDSVTTWSASARWRPSDRTMLYARVATGWRAGGPNLPFPPFPAAYEADTLTNYEIGLKSDIIGNFLRLDVSLFRIDWEDMHSFITNGAFGGNGNADTATSQGVEWDATLTPLDGLTVRWSGAYTNAELTADAPLVNGLDTLGPQGVDGAPLPYTPEWASTFAVDYEWAAFGGEAYVGGDVRYTSERVGSFTTVTPFGVFSRVELPQYTLVDLRAGLDFERYGVGLFARNVTNEDSPVSFGGSFSLPQASVPRPRTIGVEFSARF
jgi:outer membrane receptor protein involved in Fe transport